MAHRFRRLRNKLLGRIGLTQYYQEKRGAGLDERWAVIRSHISPSDRTALDVGCNIGALTAEAASLGMFALGVDIEPGAIRHACRLHAGKPNVAFAVHRLQPGSAEIFPRVDVVFCLSVHHHWYRAFGEDASWQIVGDLARKSNKLFFESASRRVKFGKNPPSDLVDLDEDSIKAYVNKHLGRVLEPGKRIEFLAKTPSDGPEKFRLLFLVH